MDKQGHRSQPEQDDWIDNILTPPTQGEEILPDEDAIASAGLIHPSDAEVEKIIQETLAENSEQPEPAPESDQQTVPRETFKDAEYRDTFGDGEDLESMFSDGNSAPAANRTDPDTAGEPSLEEPEGPEKKRRPSRRGTDNIFGLSHVLSTVIWLAVIVIIGISLGNFVWVCASDVLAFGRDDRQVTVTINGSDTMDDITQKLYDAGLIRYPRLFSYYAKLTDAREDISAGTFTLNTLYDYHALVGFMTSDSEGRAVVEVVIPEGYNCAQIFSLLENENVCTAADLEAYAADGELDDYWFLDGVTRGGKYCLEGFLFPDTYQFYTDDEPRRVLEKFLDNFEYRFSDEMIASIDELNARLSQMMADNGYDEEYIRNNQMDIFDVVTVASLIEEETANTLESYTISSVIYNRLTNQAEYPYLNIDATILYALGTHKEALTLDDLKIDSPYNTYTNPGLTPGPISNPGLYSLNAALDPDDTDYYFYAMDPATGTHHFSSSSDEHEAFLDSLGDT